MWHRKDINLFLRSFYIISVLNIFYKNAEMQSLRACQRLLTCKKRAMSNIFDSRNYFLGVKCVVKGMRKQFLF